MNSLVSLIDQHPDIVQAMLVTGAMLIIPESLILRPILGLFGFSRGGPVEVLQYQCFLCLSSSIAIRFSSSKNTKILLGWCSEEGQLVFLVPISRRKDFPSGKTWVVGLTYEEF